MIASFRHKLVFQHLPKNVGKTVRDLLREAMGDPGVIEGWDKKDDEDLAHPLADRIKVLFPRVYEMLGDPGTKVVALVRDPIGRVLSAYQEHHRQFAEHPGVCRTLGEYLDRIEANQYRSNGGYLFIHGAPQSEFLLDGDRMLATHVVSLHDPLWFHKLAVAVGLPLHPLPPMAVETVRPWVGRSEIQRILEIYQRDFELLESLEAIRATGTTFDGVNESVSSGEVAGGLRPGPTPR